MITIFQKQFAYHIKLNSYNQSVIDDIKATINWQAREYIKADKIWSISLDQKAKVEALRIRHNGTYGEQIVEEIGEIPPMPKLTINIPSKMPMRDYQAEGVAYGLQKLKFINGDEPGLGKEQNLDSLIATPNGFVRMGDIKIDDEVFGADGEVYNITGVFPQGIKDTYDIEFNDGSVVNSGIDHLWKVRDSNRRIRDKGWTIQPLSYLLKLGITSKTNTKRIESGRKPSLKWEIPLCEPVKYKEKEYLIHPYLLGVILGDGSIGNNTIVISIPDTEIETLHRLTKLLPDYMKFTPNRSAACPNYNIVVKNHTPGKRKVNPFLNEIRRLKLNVGGSKKFIPEIYQYGSVEQRKDLLRGLMDSDGSAKKNRITFHSKSKSLVDSVVILVNSLGGQSVLRTYDRSHNNKGIEYQLNVRVKFCPFYLERKISHYDIKKANYCSRYIKSVVYKGKEECQCISVSAPDKLYLTDNYTVTHNTMQTIMTIFALNAWPALIICPASLKRNWQMEWEKFVGMKAMILNDSVKNTWPTFYHTGMCKVFIVNYESLKKYFVLDIEKNDKKKFTLSNVTFKENITLFESVAIDEIHRTKDMTSQLSKFTKGICANKKMVIGLTGTPIVNTPKDLVAQLAIIGKLPEVAGNYRNFMIRYCGGMGGKGATNLVELNYKLKTTCFFQRQKKDVLKDLPDKIHQIVYCDITTKKEYNEAFNDLAKYLREHKDKNDAEINKSMKGEIMVKIGILKQISARGKMNEVQEYIEEILDSGQKVGLFIYHKEIAQHIKSVFPQTLLYTGAQTDDEKNNAVNEFQKCKKCGVRFENHYNTDHEHVPSDKNLIALSIKSGGVGLTLTAASRMAVVELPWHPADCEQIEARFHRMSQKNSVHCTYFLGKDTIDEHIYDIIEKKRSIVDTVLGVDDDRKFVDDFIKIFDEGKIKEV